MQSSLRHGVRLFATAAKPARPFWTTTTVSSITRAALWTCAECRFETRNQVVPHQIETQVQNAVRRHFSTARRRFEEDRSERKKAISPEEDISPSTQSDDALKQPDDVSRQLNNPRQPLHAASVESPHATPIDTPTSNHASLPSHVERRRGQLSKDITVFIDRLLAKASIAGQHINAYTGTDYSGIEALRTEIIDQEQRVKSRLVAVDQAKSSHQEAYVKQAAAAKEIVSLLERKASWLPADLERYMTLVRSEHINDQAVQAAKDSLSAAERELDDARAMLERLERKQYHEEQIWSDTIRRNSTWVTFGLMGFNIILLLAQILLFEPYRRRRIVREVKAALDEKTALAPSPGPDKPEGEAPVPAGRPLESVEKAVVDAVEPITNAVEPVVAAVEPVANSAVEKLTNVVEEATMSPVEEPLTDQQGSDRPLDQTLDGDKDVATSLISGEEFPEGTADLTHAAPPVIAKSFLPPDIQERWEVYKGMFQDLFSDRLVQVKQVELTTVALQGAATGVAVMGFLFLLLRPK